jgi:uncharacterized protein YjdB
MTVIFSVVNNWGSFFHTPFNNKIMNLRFTFLVTLLFLFSFSTVRGQGFCPTNIDYETGTTGTWFYYRGTVAAGPIYTLTSCPAVNGLHTLTSGAATDPYGGFPIVSPDGASYSLKLGHDSTNYCAERARYYVHVPPGPTNYSLIYHYAAVIENASSHSAAQMPRFSVIAYDSITGVTLPCDSFVYYGSPSLPGYTLSGVAGPGGLDVYYRSWTSGNIKFTGYGGHTVCLEFTASACTQGGHMGYGYLDLSCGLYAFSTNACGLTTVNLTGPLGYSGYHWYDSSCTTSYGTTRIVPITVPTVTTTYAVVLTPYSGYGCLDTLYTQIVPSTLTLHGSNDTTICSGSSVTLTSGATSIAMPITYSWSPAAGLSCTTCATPVATPTVTTAYIVTVTDGAGCIKKDTINITVVPNPGVIGGPTSVCVGSTITLTDLPGGGVWSCTPAIIATIVPGTGVLTGVSAGVANVTYTISGLCKAYSTVTVNPLPAPITGTASVCVGLTTTLSDVTPGGTWTSSDISKATVGSTTGILTGIAAGILNITYSLTSTGCYVIRSFTVNALPTPISGVSSICVGDNTLVFDGTPGGTWTSSNIAVATIGSTTGIVIGVSAGTVVFTYTLPTGCLTTFSMTVNPIPLPISGPTNLCVGSTIVLTDATTGGMWSSSDPSVAFIADPTIGSVQGLSVGVATISYSLGTGCSVTMMVTVNTSPPAIIGTPTVCVGSTTSLSDPLAGGTWTSSDVTKATVGSLSGIVTGIAAGSAVITYTALTGCSTTLVVTVYDVPGPIGGPSSVCVGLTVTEIDGTLGGTWTSSNPAVATIGLFSGVVTGISFGTCTIAYTSAVGCIATKTFTVNSAPDPIGGPSTVCVGSTITETDLIGGGTWTIAPTTVATIGSSTGVVLGVNPGIATVTYSLGAGCSTTKPITVNPLPAVIAGLSNVCVAATITLTDASPGGSWTSSLPGVATVGLGTGIVTGVAPGTTVITYTLPTFCARTKVVTVNPSPGLYTITGGGGYCTGGTGVHIGLSGSAVGVTYQLYNGVTAVGAPLPGTGFPLDFGLLTVAGTYTIKATIVLTGCTITMTGSVTITINPLPAPITGPTSVCVGSTITLADATPGGSWSTASPTATVVVGTGLVTGISAGPAIISYTSSLGCVRTTTITVNPAPAITGPLALCPGASVTEVGTPTGGGWTSSAPAVATIGPLTGIVTGITTGSSTIVYTLPTGCTTSVVVTVSLGPGPISGPASVCVGVPVTYSDLVPGGTWSSFFTTIATIGTFSGIVTGVTPGIDTIYYSLGTGCTVKKTITVNASPSPITGILNVCVGSTTTLADPTPGGTWTSTTPAVGTISVGGVVTGISAGTTLISYTVGSCPALATVTVNPLPTVIGGTLTVCVGETTNLTDGIPGGTWTIAPTIIATIGSTSGTVMGVSGGTAVVTYTLPTGCKMTAVVTVNPLPAAIGGPGTVCQGQTITLTDATPGGSWSSASPGVATISGVGVVTGITPGTSVISYTSGTTGCAITKIVTVTPTPSPIIGSTGVCVGQTTILSDGVPGGTWSSSNPGVATIGSLTGIVMGVAPGVTTITYTAGGCSITTLVTVVGSPLPITGPTNVCVGGTIIKSDATPGGIWISGNLATATINPVSGVLIGISAGTVIISYQVGTGCVAITPVVVNPVSPILGTPLVCQGQTTGLSDTTLGGTWTSSTPAIATIGSWSGIVTGISPGTTTIIYTLPTGCATNIVVTVNAVPAVITGVPIICVGQTTPLFDATPGGTWTSSNIAIAPISPTGVVTGLAAGTSLISYTLGTGCAATQMVTVNGLPAAITGPTDVCLGGTITLHEAVPGGMWTSSNPAIASIDPLSGVVSGIALGTVAIDYTLGTGCNVTSIVNVDSLPGPITGTMNLCVGTTTNLYDVTTGGTWTSGNIAVATVNPATGLVFGNSPGTSVINYSIGFGCTVNAMVTVNLLPVGISGSTNVCVGATTLLSDGTPGGTWTSSNPAIATIGLTTGLVTGVTAGAVTITYSLGTGCTATTTVNVMPSPAPITGIPAICLGMTTTLSDATPGGTWSTSNVLIAPVSTGGVVTGLALGSAVISYTAGCTSTISVTVNTMPTAIIGSPNVCVGSTTTLSDGVTGGMWSSSDPGIAMVGTTSGVVTGISPGIVTVTYSLGAGCTTTIDITVNPLPSPISGPDNVCATQSITLADATPGGTWSTGTPAVATVGSTGVVTGVSAGIVDISYTVGCSVAFTVTVNPIPGPITGNTNVCLGGTSALHDSVAGGTWWSTNTFVATVGSVSGIVNGVMLGTATISYILPGGCAVSTVVNVYPLPIVFTVSGGGSYCSGGNGEHIYLSGSTVGVNYMLYRGVTAVGTFAGTGSPLDFGLHTVAGTYTVIGTSTATTCSVPMTGSATITIIPSVTPSVVVGTNPSDTVCAGSTVTFTPTPVNGGLTPTYLWDVNGYPVAFSTTYSFIPADGDVVTVTMTSSATCPTPTTAHTSVTMIVNPYAFPSVNLATAPDDTVCKGTEVTMSALPAYGGPSPVYYWMKNGDYAGGGADYTWMPDNGDIVYCILNSSYPCRLADKDTSVTAMITVDTPVAPNVTISVVPGTMVQQGDTVKMTATVTGGTIGLTYQWLKNGIPITGATNAVYISNNFNYGKPDSVTCMVTSNGICNITGFDWVYMEVKTVGVTQLTSGGEINILPNPNKGEFVIKGSLKSLNDKEVSLEVTNMLGQVVYRNSIISKNGKLNEKVQLGNTLANGMYILSVHSESDNRVFHIVVEK